MVTNSHFDAILQTVVLAVPIAVVVTLVTLLLNGRSRRRRPMPTDQTKSPILRMVADDVAHAQPLAIATKDTTLPLRSEPTKDVGGVLPSGDQPAVAPLAVDYDIAALEQRATDAEANARFADIAPIYLMIAAAHDQSGNGAGRMTALRSAAGLAAKYGPLGAHAEARLALAEVAYQAGDLTGACEQWQLARSALLEDGQTSEHARIDKRMRDHQCPTDWVLTDF